MPLLQRIAVAITSSQVSTAVKIRTTTQIATTRKNRSRVCANGKFHRSSLSGPTAHLLSTKKQESASRRNEALRQGASGMGWSYLLYAGYAYDPYA